jgi:hypothetical protein
MPVPTPTSRTSVPGLVATIRSTMALGVPAPGAVVALRVGPEGLRDLLTLMTLGVAVTRSFPSARGHRRRRHAFGHS